MRSTTTTNRPLATSASRASRATGATQASWGVWAVGAIGAVGAALLPMASQAADNCEAIKTQIETRMRAGGLGNITLGIVPLAAGPAEAAAPRGAKVMGSCAQGTRQIVLLSSPAPVSSPPTPPAAPVLAAVAPATPAAAAPVGRPAAADTIPTECADGSIVIGPDCGDSRAVRMTKTELDKLELEAKPPAPAKPASAP